MEYGHGGDIYRNRNVELDFSVNVNPFGMPNFVWEAAQRSIAFCTGYPDSSCENLRGRLSEVTGVPEDQMIFGNGAAELIFRLVQEIRPKKAVIPAPSFAEYETALRSCGTEIAFFYLKEAESFFLNISEFLAFLRTEQPEIIFLCTPANPTGAMIRQADLSKILDYCKKHGILLVLDECFVEFLDEERSCGCIREFLDWETGTWRKLISSPGIHKDICHGGTAAGVWILYKQGALRTDGGELAALECFDPGAGGGICGTFGRTDPFFEKDAGDGGERTAVSF